MMDVYERMYRRWGPQHWWPGRTRLEVIVGAILTQNTAWRNVERAITALHEAGALDLEMLRRMPSRRLAGLIRPAGYYNLKARRLKSFVEMVWKRYDGSLRKMFAEDTAELRRVLLAVNGIGEETADSILLYAGRRPVFVVDAYTRRVMARHGWVEQGADYRRLAERIVAEIPRDVQLYNEYHALLVRLGKEHCRRRPVCEECPLEDLLPRGGGGET